MQKFIHNKITIRDIIATTLLLAFTLSLPFAAGASTGDSGTKKSVDATCMQSVVDTREAAIASTFTTFNSSLTTALASRKSALHDAWGLGDVTARRDAIKKAWANWKTAKKTAHTKLKSERKTAWEKFKTDAKACKVEVPKEEGLEKESAGSLSL